MNKIKSILFVLTLGILCFCFLVFAPELSKGVSNGILISIQTLIPSMFGFITLADFIGHSGYCKVFAMPLSVVFQRVFKLDTELGSIFLLSAIGGYPTGALLISAKLEKQQISIQTAQFLLRFCILPSPAFLIAAISQNLWNTPKIGIAIYCSQVISALLIALIGRFSHEFYSCSETTSTEKLPLSNIFVSSVRRGISSMSMICGFVILFCGGFAILDLFNLPVRISIFLKGVLEVTSGCQMISGLNFIESIVFVSAVTAFGGLCVHLQIIAILRKFKLKLFSFFMWRVCFAAISSILSYIVITILFPNVPCFTATRLYSYKICSVSPVSSFFLLVLGFMLLGLFFSENYGKIKKQREN